MRLDINYEKNTVTNTWRLNNMFVNNEPVTEEIKREIQKFLETNDNESTTQNLRDAAVQRRVYGNTILPQETRETSNIQPKFIPKRN